MLLTIGPPQQDAAQSRIGADPTLSKRRVPHLHRCHDRGPAADTYKQPLLHCEPLGHHHCIITAHAHHLVIHL